MNKLHSMRMSGGLSALLKVFFVDGSVWAHFPAVDAYVYDICIYDHKVWLYAIMDICCKATNSIQLYVKERTFFCYLQDWLRVLELSVIQFRWKCSSWTDAKLKIQFEFQTLSLIISLKVASKIHLFDWKFMFCFFTVQTFEVVMFHCLEYFCNLIFCNLMFNVLHCYSLLSDITRDRSGGKRISKSYFDHCERGSRWNGASTTSRFQETSNNCWQWLHNHGSKGS